ncbi:hypothetical protein J31TS4_33000 [Paenibacillus sp. J31TS4]|uniref:NfeD family protein n=1 Tax=Paenibacillus sp. J31TS4 TaxID=2807195 RepID=UPI001B1EBCD6|nr:NfeD family protein [Paenibacillus sp. J31TS4]GIP40020.1 hypothetical protein J31TS4_33000 [Paenibacillus sp. J31TS4]
MLGWFWGCLVFGVLFALVTVLVGDLLGDALGGLFDFLSADAFQPMVLTGAVTVFGGAGILLTRYTALAPGSVVLGAGAAGVLSGVAIVYGYVKPMRRMETSVGYSLADLKGRIGEVLVPVPAAGYGEVLIRAGGGVTNQIAASLEQEELPSGTRVVVVEVKEGTLLVSKLEELDS